MLEEVVTKSSYDGVFQYTPRRALEALTGAIRDKAQYVGVVSLNSPVGFLWGSRAYPPWSDDLMGIEIVWYVPTDYQKLGIGKVLETEFREWCITQGCAGYTMGNGLGIETEDIVDTYLKKNYTPVEKIYVTCL